MKPGQIKIGVAIGIAIGIEPQYILRLALMHRLPSFPSDKRCRNTRWLSGITPASCLNPFWTVLDTDTDPDTDTDFVLPAVSILFRKRVAILFFPVPIGVGVGS